MEILKNLNLGIAFLLELAMLVIYGFFGYRLLPAESVGILKIGLAILLPVIMAVIWGFRLAPRAVKRLKMPWLLIAKIIIFGGWCSHVVGTGENIIGNHRGSCDRRTFDCYRLCGSRHSAKMVREHRNIGEPISQIN